MDTVDSVDTVDSEAEVVAGDVPARRAAGGEWSSPPTWVLAAPPTVAATRDLLAELDGPGASDASQPSDVKVVGWADLSAPNLVDLLDDLATGPGGYRLAAIAVHRSDPGAAWLDDVAVRRGLGCLRRAGLSLHLVGAHPPDVLARLAGIEPGLGVIADEAVSGGAGEQIGTG